MKQFARFSLLFAWLSTTFLLNSMAQSTTIDLPQLYVSQNNSVTFRYPSDWVVAEEPNFVSVSDGSITIEFYKEELTDRILQLSPNNIEDGVTNFFNVLGINYQGETRITLDNQVVVGGLHLDTGQAMYVLLGIGRLVPPPGWIMIRIQGNAIDLLGDTDTFMAILNSFGSLQIAGANDAPKGDSATAEPAAACFIRVSQANSAQVRVGPGSNRGVLRFLEANRDFTVLGTANASDGTKWWRINKDEVAAGIGANETWVADSQVTTIGGCDQVGTLSAPPIIRVRPTADSNAGTGNNNPQPTPIAGSTEVFVNFFATPSRIQPGDCAEIVWDVRNGLEVYFVNDFSVNEPVQVNASDSQTVCPTATSDYSLRIVHAGSTPNSTANDIFRNLTITVDTDFVLCSFDALPFFETGSIAVGEEAYHFIFLDPCLGNRRIFIEMFATSNDLDPYIDIFIDSVYYGSNDDSGGLNSYIEVDIPAGAEVISITAKSFGLSSGGDYEILADRLP